MIDELEMRLLHEADHPACDRDIWPEDLLRDAAADIVVKKAAIAESARTIHKLMSRALAAESRLAEAMKLLDYVSSFQVSEELDKTGKFSDVCKAWIERKKSARRFLNAWKE